MSRRGNNVQGPTSALTEFLRESGITVTSIARRIGQTRAGPSNVNEVRGEENGNENNENSNTRSTRRTRQNAVIVADDSDHLDEEEEENKPVAKKRKLSKAEEKKLKAKERAEVRKAKGDDDDDDFEDSEEDKYTAPSRKTRARKQTLSKAEEKKLKAKERAKAGKNKGDDDGDGDDDDDDDDDSYGYCEDEDGNEYTGPPRKTTARKRVPPGVRPPVGSFENCVKCKKQFTVTQYTVAALLDPGWLCHDCAKASGMDPFKKPAAPRKRMPQEAKRKIAAIEEKPLPTLASLCIEIISQHIDDVEALGDIGSVNRREIGRVLSKNRSLTAENAILLYDIKNLELKFYDATKLGPNAYCTLASLNPSLHSLHLDFCGKINDMVLQDWTEHLPELRRLELLGPFLVKSSAWQAFFAGHPKLTGFLITQSPHFDLESIASLVQHCSDLTELKLSFVEKLDDGFLSHIGSFASLTHLELSAPGISLSSTAVIDLLKIIGHRLVHLNLSKNEELNDDVFSEGLAPNARVLESLVLEELSEVTDAAVGAFFDTTINTPLTRISLRRNHKLADNALSGLLKHSGPKLQELDINSWKAVSNQTLLTIGESAKALKKLDIGYCREVDDFVIKEIMEGCENIAEIMVFGCNKLTLNCPKKRGVTIEGIETHTV